MHKSNTRDKQKFYFSIFTISRKLIFSIIILFFVTTAIYGQETDKPRHFGIQGGIISGILDDGIGPSFSFHYAFWPEKVLQPEAALSLESQKGETFLSGYSANRSALSLTAGIRFNIRPQKNWNPSILIMGGIMFGKGQADRSDDPGNSGVSEALNIGISNTFNRKHMITLGGSVGEYVDGFYLKYGYWF